MLKVTKLRVCNFRSCKDVEIDLDAFTPLVGPNNAGKSTLLNALSWCLAPSTLQDADFRDPDSPVTVDIAVDGVSDDVLTNLTKLNRKKVEPLIKDGRLRLSRVCPAPGTTASKTQELVRDPAVVDEEAPDAWKRNPGGIWNAINSAFPDPIRIGAMEDSAEDASKAKNTTTLGKLIAALTVDIAAELSLDYEASIKDIANKLSADGDTRTKRLIEFDEDATAAVQDFFPGVEVKLHIPTPDLQDFFKSGTIAVWDDHQRREFSALGHGAQRSIQMALIRVLAERNAKSGGGAPSTTRLLLIDEPELYLHPAAIYTLREALSTLSTNGYQVVFSTHSALLVDKEDAADTVIIGKDQDCGTFARPTLRHKVQTVIDGSSHQALTLFSLTNSNEFLFARRVVVAEGKTEKRLLPELVRAVKTHWPRHYGLALVDVGGVGSVKKSATILHALGLTTRVVVDLDFAFRGAIAAGWVSDTDPRIATCRSQIKTLARANGCALNGGLPCKGGKMRPSKLWDLLAQDPTASAAIQEIHSDLLRQDVWIWTLGAIEAALGLNGKNEATWAKYACSLQANGLQATVSHPSIVEDFVAWLVG